MRAEGVERAHNLKVHLAASVRRKRAYKLELAAVNVVSKVRQAFVDLRGALQAVVESSNRFVRPKTLLTK